MSTMPQRTISAATPRTRGGSKLFAASQVELNLVKDYGVNTVQSGDFVFAPTGGPGGSSKGAPYPAPTGGPDVVAAATDAPHPPPMGGPGVTEAQYPAPTGRPSPMEAHYPAPTSEPYLGAGVTEVPPTGGTYPGADATETQPKGGKSKKGKGKPSCPPTADNEAGGITDEIESGSGADTTESQPFSPTGRPSATEAPYRAPTGISPGPSEFPHGGDDTDGAGSSDGNSTDTDGGDGADGLPAPILDCVAVRAGKAPTSGPSTELDANLDLAFYTEEVGAEAVRQSVYNVMNDYVRLWTLGCEVASGRRLEEATMINALMDETREYGTCKTSITGASCVSLYTPTKAIYTGGDTSGFQDRLDNATQKAINDGLFAFDGVVQVNIPGEDGWTDPDPTPPGTTSTAQKDQGLRTAGKISIAVTAVTVLLSALLFVRRRRSIKDESVIKQINCTDLLLDDRENKTFPVGDSESMDNEVVNDIVDDSLPLTPTSIGGAHDVMDVHVCQSSLCAACMQTKQNSEIFFVKTEAPSSPPIIPDDASRAYSASDTVLL